MTHLSREVAVTALSFGLAVSPCLLHSSPASGSVTPPGDEPVVGGGATGEPDVVFGTLLLQFSDEKVSGRLELFLRPWAGTAEDLQIVARRAAPPQVTLDDEVMALQAAEPVMGPPARLRFDLTAPEVPTALKRGSRQLVVAGLKCPRGTELRLTLVAARGTVLAGASPSAVETRVSELPDGGERTSLHYNNCPDLLVVDIERGVEENQAGVLSLAVKHGTPIVTALIILVISTFVSTILQRYLMLRGSQQGIYQALRVRVQRAEYEPRKVELRKEIVDYIKGTRERPEYGGFDPEFTDPLEEILKAGILDDVSFYRTQLDAIRMRVNTGWVLFAGIKTSP